MGLLSNLFNKAKSVVVKAINKVKESIQTVIKNISNSIKQVETAVSNVKTTVKKDVQKSVQVVTKAVQDYSNSWKETISKSVENANLQVTKASLVAATKIQPSTGTIALIAAVTPTGPVEAGLEKIGAKEFIEMFSTKAAGAIALFKGASAGMQTDFLNKLLAEKGGLAVAQGLLKNKAVDESLAKAAAQAINKKLAAEILAPVGKNIVTSAAAKIIGNPIFKIFSIGIISVFALTEIPNYFNMRIFARSQVAQNAGLDPNQVTYPLNTQDTHFKNLQYELSLAMKTPDYKKADEILKEMETVRDAFGKIITDKENVLVQIAMLDTEQANLEYMNSIISRTEAEIAPQLEKLKLEIPDTIKGKVREITDGDTIRVEWTNPPNTYVNVSAVRLVGINSPESSEKGYKESKAWLNSQIWGKEIVLGTDANNRKDVYDRILAVVFLNGEDMNLKSVKNGWSMTYFLEAHRLVNQTQYQAAEDYARNENLGVWALNKEYGSIGVGSKPTHAKIYIDGEYTKLQTSETLKNIEPGEHTIKLSLSGYKMYSEAITVEENQKAEIYAVLEKETGEEPVTPTITPPEPGPEPEPGPSNWPDYHDVAVADSAIPATFTDSQSWALGEAFTKIEVLMKGHAVMNEAERKTLMDSFLLYTDEQKLVLNLLWQDVAFLEKGSRQMSDEEFNNLKSKYRIEAIA